MGLDIIAYRGVRAIPEGHFMEAYEDEELLDPFGNGTLSSGWIGWPTEVAYGYRQKFELSISTFAGVSSFYRVLAKWKGHPGASNDPAYTGPFCQLFECREWMGPVDCRTIALELAALQDAWLDPPMAKMVESEGWSLPEFIDYFLLWRRVFDFVEQDGILNFC